MLSRRLFLERLGLAAAGSVVAYSFPSIIIPKSIMSLEESIDSLKQLNSIIVKEIYPRALDLFFADSPLLAYLKDRQLKDFSEGLITRVIPQVKWYNQRF